MTVSPAELFGRFLHEPDISERARVTREAVDGLPPDEALSALFSALNIAVDGLRAVAQIAVSFGLSPTAINEELGRLSERRSSDYVEYQFRRMFDLPSPSRQTPDRLPPTKGSTPS